MRLPKTISKHARTTQLGQIRPPPSHLYNLYNVCQGLWVSVSLLVWVPVFSSGVCLFPLAVWLVLWVFVFFSGCLLSSLAVFFSGRPSCSLCVCLVIWVSVLSSGCLFYPLGVCFVLWVFVSSSRCLSSGCLSSSVALLFSGCLSCLPGCLSCPLAVCPVVLLASACWLCARLLPRCCLLWVCRVCVVVCSLLVCAFVCVLASVSWRVLFSLGVCVRFLRPSF